MAPAPGWQSPTHPSSPLALAFQPTSPPSPPSPPTFENAPGPSRAGQGHPPALSTARCWAGFLAWCNGAWWALAAPHTHTTWRSLGKGVHPPSPPPPTWHLAPTPQRPHTSHFFSPPSQAPCHTVRLAGLFQLAPTPILARCLSVVRQSPPPYALKLPPSRPTREHICALLPMDIHTHPPRTADGR